MGYNLVYTAVAGVTDDSIVTNVSFLVDGVHRWDDTNSPYTFGWDDMVAGTHQLRVIASDDSGASSSNELSIIVTNPPDIEVIVANGQTWEYSG